MAVKKMPMKDDKKMVCAKCGGNHATAGCKGKKK